MHPFSSSYPDHLINDSIPNSLITMLNTHHGVKSDKFPSLRSYSFHHPDRAPSIEERLKAMELRIKELGNQIQERDNRLQVLERTQLEPWLQNVAAAVLLFLVDQRYSNTTSDRDGSPEGQLLSPITNDVNANENWELKKFRQAADGIIASSRRKAAMLPSSVDELDALVIQAQNALTVNPYLRSTLPSESMIIDDYEVIKKFFPAK